MARATVAALLGGAFACAGKPPHPDASVAVQATEGGLVLAKLVPDSGSIANDEIVVVRAIGSGFVPEDNEVQFGPVVMTRVRASATGDTLVFTVPLEIPSRGEAPPQRLDPGDYEVVVRVGDRRSAPLRFTVTYASATLGAVQR